MKRQINVDDLDPETQVKLGLSNNGHINKKVIVLGRVISALSKLDKADAMWVLRTASVHISGRDQTRGRPRKKEEEDGSGEEGG